MELRVFRDQSVDDSFATFVSLEVVMLKLIRIEKNLMQTIVARCSQELFVYIRILRLNTRHYTRALQITLE